MSDFLDPYTPNFIFKGENALFHYGLIIENELSEMTAKPRYEEIEVVGRNGALHEWHNDYAPFDFKIPNVSVEYGQIENVKRWLSGYGQLITHNDSDKYRNAICNMSVEQEYKNEWGTFYSFDILFRCDPLRRKVNEKVIELFEGTNERMIDGDEIAKPYFEIDSLGGDITISIGDKSLTLLNTFSGPITVDTELGKYIQDNSQQRSKGQWVELQAGKNVITLTGKFRKANMLARSVWR